jgi:hypothetical protein
MLEFDERGIHRRGAEDAETTQRLDALRSMLSLGDKPPRLLCVLCASAVKLNLHYKP